MISLKLKYTLGRETLFVLIYHPKDKKMVFFSFTDSKYMCRVEKEDPYIHFLLLAKDPNAIINPKKLRTLLWRMIKDKPQSYKSYKCLCIRYLQNKR